MDDSRDRSRSFSNRNDILLIGDQLRYGFFFTITSIKNKQLKYILIYFVIPTGLTP